MLPRLSSLLHCLAQMFAGALSFSSPPAIALRFAGTAMTPAPARPAACPVARLARLPRLGRVEANGGIGGAGRQPRSPRRSSRSG